MKISSIVFTDLILKSFLGAITFLIYGVSINDNAIASTLNFQSNNTYELEEISDFSLKLDRNISNQLEKEIFKQQSMLSNYVDLIDNGLDKNQYQAETVIKILVQSQEDKEQKLLESLLVSLKQLELTRFSEDNSSPATIATLPQVDYRNLYKDVYDFDIELTSPSASQPQSPNRNAPRSILTVRQPRNLKSFTSYFQGNKKFNYPSFENKSINKNNTYASLLASPKDSVPLKPSLTDLVSSSLSDSSFSTTSNNFSSSQNRINTLNNLNNLESSNYNAQPENEDNSQLGNDVQAIYLPSTQVEIYQVTNFNVPSPLSSYQKPEHQEELDKILEKQEKKQQKQREKISRKLEKLRQKREKARQKKLEQYRKQREKALAKAIKQQTKQQTKQQKQLR